MSDATLLEVVNLQVESLGGNIYLKSRDVPGLYLWGTPETVFDSVIPALEALYKHNRHLDVEVRSLDERPHPWSGVEIIGVSRLAIYVHGKTAAGSSVHCG